MKIYVGITLLSFCHEHEPRLSITLHMSNASSPGFTSVYFGCSANFCNPYDTVKKINEKYLISFECA